VNSSGVKIGPNTGSSVNLQKNNTFLDDWLAKRKNIPKQTNITSGSSGGTVQNHYPPVATTVAPTSIADSFIKHKQSVSNYQNYQQPVQAGNLQSQQYSHVQNQIDPQTMSYNSGTNLVMSDNQTKKFVNSQQKPKTDAETFESISNSNFSVNQNTAHTVSVVSSNSDQEIEIPIN
jgi:hypothetical protein